MVIRSRLWRAVLAVCLAAAPIGLAAGPAKGHNGCNQPSGIRAGSRIWRCSARPAGCGLCGATAPSAGSAPVYRPPPEQAAPDARGLWLIAGRPAPISFGEPGERPVIAAPA